MTNARFDVRWTPADGVPRAVLFEPRDGGWIRAKFEWTGERWRELERERERVTEVACFGSREPVAPDGPLPRPVGGADDG